MLSMSNIGSVGQAASYYAEDNYYSQDENQARSAWEGEGAQRLGLSGEVNAEEFKKILSGEIEDQKLGKITGKDADGNLILDHRPGVDVTLSAPKSVSLLAEVDGRGDVREAHEKAATKVLEYIEKNFAGARVTVGGETTVEKTDNIIAARFHHTTSRDLDPQTHTHMVIANATQTQDGVWRSLQNDPIYNNQKLLGSIYDAELAANLRELGYRLENTANGKWEVAGITRDQIEQFSQRSKAIEERLESFGLTRETATQAQKEAAALHTRSAKQDVDHTALRENWKERADGAGIDFGKIEADRQVNVNRPIDPSFSTENANGAVRFAIEHLTERESVVARNEVLQTALTHAEREAVWAGVRIGDVEKALTAAVSEKGTIETKEGAITTTQALERERLMLTMLENGRGKMQPITTNANVDKAIAHFEATKSTEINAPFLLKTGQEEAARVVLTGEDRFIGVQGYAGVGKTTMLELVNTTATAAGYLVRGMATSASAAQTLQQESGIQSTTTAGFLLDEGRRAAENAKPEKITIVGAVDLKGNDYRSIDILVPKNPDSIVRKELWVVDEASLAGQREASSIMAMAERANAKVVFVGDKLQLNAVEAGKPFELLQRAGIAGAEMTQINRQQVADLQQAVAFAVNRENQKAFTHLADRVVEIPNKGALFDRVVSDILSKYPEDRHNALIVVPLNSDRKEINDRVRSGLQERGDIEKTGIVKDVLVGTGFSDAQKRSIAYYEANMVVRFGRDYKSLDVARGDYGKVIDVNIKTRTATLEAADGKHIQWRPEKQTKVEVYSTEKRDIAVGDELRFTRNNKELEVHNGTLAKVTSVSNSGITLTTKGGEVNLQVNEKQQAHIDYAYATTVPGSQGKTAADANLLITSDSGRAMGERSFYVGSTRSKTDFTIYTDSKSNAMNLIVLSQDKTSAMESLKNDATDGGKVYQEGATKNNSGGRNSVAEL